MSSPAILTANSEPSSSADPDLRRAWLLLRPEERAPVALAALAFYCVLASYYVLRPIRDELAVYSGASNLHWLFLGTLTLTLLWTAAFSRLVSLYPRRLFVPYALRGFSLLLLIFLLLWLVLPSGLEVWLGRAFYVFVSAFNLILISLTWSLMVDSFSVEQSRRLFALIAVGGSLGAATGSTLTALLVEHLPIPALLLVSIGFLEFAVRAKLRLFERIAQRSDAQAELDTQTIGGHWHDAYGGIVRSPYLLGIALFVALFTIGSTFVYAMQASIVEQSLVDRVAQRQYFARLDQGINGLTLFLQVFVSAQLFTRLRLRTLLAVLPLLSIAGFAALAMAPTLATVAAFQLSRRALDFSIMRPAREMLFLPLARREKYKAKSLIDAFVYRIGDQVGVLMHAGLLMLGLGLSGIALAAIPLALFWLTLAVWLGRRHRQLLTLRHEESQ